VKATARDAVPRSSIVSASPPVAVTAPASAVTTKSQLEVAVAAAVAAAVAGGEELPSQIAAPMPMPMPTPRAAAATSVAMRKARRRGVIAAAARESGKGGEAWARARRAPATALIAQHDMRNRSSGRRPKIQYAGMHVLRASSALQLLVELLPPPPSPSLNSLALPALHSLPLP
jgi:hypothetical protein